MLVWVAAPELVPVAEPEPLPVEEPVAEAAESVGVEDGSG